MKRVFIACAAFAMTMMVSCTTPTNNTTVKESKESKESVEVTQTSIQSDVAYVDVDLAISQCEIYKTEGVALQKKTEKMEASLSQKDQTLQSDMSKLQDKYQRGLITSTNAQLEQENIQKRAVELQEYAQKEMGKLEEESVVFTNRTSDLIRRAVNEINSDKRYKLIINASSLIDADTTLNITSQVVEIANRLYGEDQAESKK